MAKIDVIYEGSHIKQMKPSTYSYWRSKSGYHIFKNEDGKKEAFIRHKYPVPSWQLRMGNAFFEFAHSITEN